MALGQVDIYAIVALVSSLATIAVAARFWVRKLTKARRGADDWTILISVILMWGLSATVLRGAATEAFGSHVFGDPTINRPEYDHHVKHTLKFHMAVWVMTILLLGLVKISVVLLYRRLFRVKSWFRIYSVILIVFLALWTTGFFFAKLFQCGTRMWSFWTISAERDRICKASDPISNWFTISDVATDVVVVLSPIPVLWGIRLPVSQRLAVMGVFAMGFLSTAAGALRAYVLLDINFNRQAGPKTDSEIIVIVTKIAVLSIAEIAVAIIAACLTTLRPLVAGDHPCNLVRKVRSRVSSSAPSMSRSSLRRRSGTYIGDMNAEVLVSGGHETKLHYIQLQEPCRTATRERYCPA